MTRQAVISFNSGELTPNIDARIDLEKYRSGCRMLENMIPTKYGGALRRPGFLFIHDSTESPNSETTTTIRMVSFIYSSTIAYIIEFGAKYARFYYGNNVLTDESSNEVWIETPYEEKDLFQLKFKQIADTMWIVHPSYAPRKLTRTDIYTFELNEIDFRHGPFMVRNDLADPDNPSTTTLQCAVRKTGQTGALIASSGIFLDSHEGALFKLWHARSPKRSSIDGDGTSQVTSIITGKGTYNLISRGTWDGKVIWYRREFGGSWDELRRWRSSESAALNINYSYTEEFDFASHQIWTDGNEKLKLDISIDEPLQAGIVKIITVESPFTCSVEVYSNLASTSATTRWAEGCWSPCRGYPGAIGFYEERSVYGGAIIPLTDEEFSALQYPLLR